MSWARWNMIQHLKRNLTDDECVDHIDNDPLNDSIENYQILSVAENARKSLKGRQNPTKGVERGFCHGTYYSWMKKKCRCDDCLKAQRHHYDIKNEKRKKNIGA
jgi:hypothetical protein